MAILPHLRHAFRSLVRTPAFSLVTILTLALGIGVNTAIFSVVSAVLLRPLPFPQPEQLVYISTQFPTLGFDQFWVSPPEFLELQERAQSFSAIGALASGQSNLSAADRPRRVVSARASADLFTALGTAPLLGRVFEVAETRPNGADVAILSEPLWRSAFGANPNILGQRVEVTGVMRTIVGVMPEGFDAADMRIELWLPLVGDPANRQNRGSHSLYVIGRLKENVSLAAARAELETLVAAWPSTIARAADATNGPHTPNPQTHRIRYDPLHDQIVGPARIAIGVLQGAVVLVLLIACANVANLLLARAESRHKEFAIRASLGASGWQLLAPFAAEGFLLSATGALLGVALGSIGLRLVLVAFPDSLPRAGAIDLDASVLGFSLLVALACAAVFSLTPLLHLRRDAGASALKDGGQRSTASRTRQRLRQGLVVAEVALAVALVIGAGLLLRTVLNISRVDAGFNREQLVTFGVSLPPARYSNAPQILAFHRRLLDAIRATPGVREASAMSGLPPSRQLNANDTDIEGYTAQPGGPAENVDYYQSVLPGYIETMGIPVVEGRAFQSTDAGDTTVLVNQTLAKRFFPDSSAIGRRLRCCGPADKVPWFTIIGVVKDVKQGGIDQRTGTELYFNVEQLPTALPNSMPATMNVVMRTTLSSGVLSTAVQRAVGSLDPALPVIRLRSMDDVFTQSMGRPRLLANLLGVFAFVAVTLALIGSFGVLSYMVSERRREIGIRMALGAARGGVMRMVLSQGMQVALIGVALGVAGALSMSGVLRSLLFGVSPFDPTTLVAVCGLILLVSLVSCYLPARAATLVEPTIALKGE